MSGSGTKKEEADESASPSSAPKNQSDQNDMGEDEDSLHDITDDIINEDKKSSDEDDAILQKLLQEALGITETGTCLRHANCPVVTGLVASDNSKPADTRLVSCRVCYAEEKSSGIHQPKTTFATVVQQLHRQADEEQLSQSQAAIFHNSLNMSGTMLPMVLDNSESEASNSINDVVLSECNTATRLLLFLQSDASAMESVMKRLAQVQNWTLRQKEQQIVKLQLHCQRLEKQVTDLQRQSNEQRSTIQSLRKSIQQDLKVIKTFAKQQQMQEEAAADMLLMQQQQQQQLDATSEHTVSQQQQQPSPGTVGAYVSPSKRSPHPTSRAGNKTASSTPGSAGARGTFSPPAPLQTTTSFIDSSIPIPEDGEQDLEAAEEATRRQKSFYWNGDEHRLQSSRNIYQSFRGGLLDIPKSPPLARHDRDVDGAVQLERKKLQLNKSAMNALQLPERALSRNNSAAVPQQLPPKRTHSKEIPLDALAAKLGSVEIEQRKIQGMSPEQLFEGVASNPKMPKPPALDNTNNNDNHTVVSATYSIMTMATTKTAAAEATSKTPVPPSSTTPANQPTGADNGGATGAAAAPAAASSGGDAATATGSTTSNSSNGSDKFVFSVTDASCHDKFGDEGTYTGSILVTEGLPHGQGQMDYESGRVYEGEWVAGQWHGKGKLLNPNGDTYQGEFFFDARHGQGVYRWDNGDVYVGQFSSDKRHGKGKFSFHNGNVYEGEFCDGMFEGFGRYEFAGGYYEGDWKEGRYDGAGELLYANGGKYTGEFRHSVAHGFGMEVMPDGTKRRGVWADGKPTEYFGTNN